MSLPCKKIHWILLSVLVVTLFISLTRQLPTARKTRDLLHASNGESNPVNDCHVDNEDASMPSSKSLPRYPMQGICHSLPANVSATFLWNEHLDRILSKLLLTNNMPWIQDLLNTFSPFLLRQSILSSPKHVAWKSLVAKFLQQDSSSSSPLSILIFMSEESHAAQKRCDRLPKVLMDANQQQQQQPINRDCSWPQLLQQVADLLLGSGRVDIQIMAVPYFTTEWANLLIPQLKHSPDIILHDLSIQDIYRPNRTVDVSQTVDYTHALRTQRQTFLRTVLLSAPSPCLPPPSSPSSSSSSSSSETATSRTSPLPIILDDYVGGHHPQNLLSETIGGRVWQRLADWYQVPLISFATLVQSMILAAADDIDRTQFVFSLEENEVGTRTNTNTNIVPSTLGQVLIASSLTFAFLDYTLDYCFYESTTMPSTNENILSLLQPGVEELVQTVVPPPLTPSLTLQEVSMRWREQQQKQQLEQTQHQSLCAADKRKKSSLSSSSTSACPLVWYTGQATNTSPWNRYLLNNTGWIMEQTRWTSTTMDSCQVWKLPTNDDNKSNNHWLHLVVITHPDTKHDSLLEIEIRHLSTNQVLASKTISNTHPSDTTRSKVHSIDWRYPRHVLNDQDSDNEEYVLELKLIQQGIPFELFGVFLCHGLDDDGMVHN